MDGRLNHEREYRGIGMSQKFEKNFSKIILAGGGKRLKTFFFTSRCCAAKIQIGLLGLVGLREGQ